MWYRAEEREDRGRQPDRSAAEQSYRRQIDCTPRSDVTGTPPSRAGRGRGIPDPERWPRDPGTREPRR